MSSIKVAITLDSGTLARVERGRLAWGGTDEASGNGYYVGTPIFVVGALMALAGMMGRKPATA